MGGYQKSRVFEIWFNGLKVIECLKLRFLRCSYGVLAVIVTVQQI